MNTTPTLRPAGSGIPFPFGQTRGAFSAKVGALLSVAVFVGTVTAPLQAAPTVNTAAKLDAVFQQVCLANYPDVGKMRNGARKLGLKSVNETQWSTADTSLSVFVFGDTARPEKGVFNLAILAPEQGWETVSFSPAAAAGLKRSEAGCAVAAVRTPGSGLSQHIGQKISAHGQSTLRANKAGSKGRGNATINGHKARVEIKMLKATTAVPYAFVSIVGRR